MNSTITRTTTLTELLTKRLDAWDKQDKALNNGHPHLAFAIENELRDNITPQIREAYGL